MLNQIPFIHVHGRLGALPWQDDGSVKIAYGQKSPEAIEKAAGEIKISFEITHATMHDFELARGPIGEASEIFFLGFGYRPENIERLQVPFSDVTGNWPNNHPRIICGTAYGLTDDEKTNIQRNRCRNMTLGHTTYKIDEFLHNCYHFLSDT